MNQPLGAQFVQETEFIITRSKSIIPVGDFISIAQKEVFKKWYIAVNLGGGRGGSVTLTLLSGPVEIKPKLITGVQGFSGYCRTAVVQKAKVVSFERI